ncbi:biotin--[acetyl-CoA-carboxylase] ligase [Bhargavaea cecembensis]|uniref:biotin--[acetyl-CoA-carboxylase] ligase n=1 Tax=Bhargavaea cecembensis TaxID=394098 RepID=UPI00058F3F81|nr:biotin--[acetyl-CoA-carboxylase] ligase [Bhargavaea cecembensis]
MESKVKDKESLLARLLGAGGEPLSGQALADEAGVSRTAVWKWIKELEEEGYTIRPVRKKGYVLEGVPDIVSPELLRSHLGDDRFVSRILHFPTVESTMPIAHKEAQEEAPHGTVVIADEQTSGKGRLARPWDSAAGKGIWMSVILKPDIPPHRAPQFTLIAAVAVSNAIREEAGVEALIKWPNDLLIGNRKVTGILTELQADPDRVQAIIIGIGINVNQEPGDFPEELKDIATSVRIHAGREISRARLAASVLRHLGRLSDLYLTEGFSEIRRMWEERAVTIGRRVKAVMVRETVYGTAIGITDDGVLEVRLDDGQIRGIYSADIELQN